MPIGRREFYLLDLKYDELDEFVEEVKSFIANENIPKDYTVDVYKDQVACCGILPIGIAIEIEGPEEKPIKDLDIMMYSKIIEICERKGTEYHEYKLLEVL